jgi:hypothetical protein
LEAIVLCVYVADQKRSSPTAAPDNVATPTSFVRAVSSAAGVAPNDEAVTAAPPIGTRDTVLAGPLVPRPSGPPCVVELFREVEMPAGRAHRLG